MTSNLRYDILSLMTTLALRDYQEQCITRLDESHAKGVTRAGVVLPTGSGKGHPLDTKIFTPDGMRIWGDLQSGDYIYDGNGKPTRITNIYDRGILPSFLITFSDKSSIITDAEHLWMIRDSKYRRTSKEWRIVSTQEILELGLRYDKFYRWRIPVEATYSNDVYLPIGPYTLGALIANGYLMGTSPVLTTPDDFVANRVQDEHSITHYNVDESLYCPRFSVLGIIKYIKDLNLDVHSRDKFIPRKYLEAGTKQRLALLQGLMDCDGSSRKERRSVNYHTTSKRLADDIVELVNSLGGTANYSIQNRTQSSNGNSYQEFTVYILMPSNTSALSTPRKFQFDNPKKIFEPRRAIVSIEQIADQPIRCITVESPTRLYQVTRHRIVTHNTVIFGHLAARHLDNPSAKGRVVVLVHRDELVRQTVNKLKAIAPKLRVGVVKAKENDVDADVIVASVQTASRPGRVEQIRNVGRVIVDECHHAAAESYRSVLGALGSWNGLPTDGFTATMIRADAKKLGDIWEEIAFKRDILWMIHHGYLVDVKGWTVEVEDLNLDEVTRSRGDFQEGSLSNALMNSDAAQQVAEAYYKHTPDQYGVLFAPTVQSTQMFADVFNENDIPTECVFGTTSLEDRPATYRRVTEGSTKILANCMVLTEGFDMPKLSVAINCRPTQSSGLYIQMAGRVLRPYPGKTHATILDVAGVASQHSLSGIVDLTQSRKAKPLEPGQSLAEAAAAWDSEPEWFDASESTTKLHLTEIDLFAQAHSVWLQTDLGTWFVQTAKEYFVLWPLKSGEYRVIRTPQQNLRAAKQLSEDLPLDFAMAVAEAEVSDVDPTLSSKSAKWRKSKVAATNAQILYAMNLGIEEPGQYTKAELSNMITIRKASKALDPLLTVRNG